MWWNKVNQKGQQSCFGCEAQQRNGLLRFLFSRCLPFNRTREEHLGHRDEVSLIYVNDLAPSLFPIQQIG